MFNILAILVFVLAWLGFLVLVAILAGMMDNPRSVGVEAKLARPRPKHGQARRNRYHARLVTIKPAISSDHQVYQSPIEDDEWEWENIYDPKNWS